MASAATSAVDMPTLISQAFLAAPAAAPTSPAAASPAASLKTRDPVIHDLLLCHCEQTEEASLPQLWIQWDMAYKRSIHTILRSHLRAAATKVQAVLGAGIRPPIVTMELIKLLYVGGCLLAPSSLDNVMEGLSIFSVCADTDMDASKEKDHAKKFSALISVDAQPTCAEVDQLTVKISH